MQIIKLEGLASYLVFAKLLNAEKAKEAVHQAQSASISLITFLVKNKILSSEIILKNCAKTFGLEIFDMQQYQLTWLNNFSLSTEFIQRQRIVPLQKDSLTFQVGISDPTNRLALDTVAFHTGLRIIPKLIDETQLDQFIQRHFSSDHSLELDLLEQVSQNESSLILFVENLLTHAIKLGASDVHIEPYDRYCRIRYRQDGLLYEIAEISNPLAIRIISRLKILSNLDIAERRLPQDGRFQFQSQDIRLSSCPTLFGEKIVLRILHHQSHLLNLDNLQLSTKQKNLFLKKIAKPQGMILVTGPTGSGKTVTLYTALNLLNSSTKNISTVEDPIEIQLKGINQINIHPKIGLQFSTLLRTLLRQDPDVLMVGEIRDTETAEIALQAAQTGHLVLSTLHTNSALEAFSRLQAMGIPAYQLLHSITLIIAQRLLRKLCNLCKRPDEIESGFYQAIGCPECLQGYRDRMSIYEFLPLTKKVKTYLSLGKYHLIEKYRQQKNWLSLKESALRKVANGTTSLAEMNRVMHS